VVADATIPVLVSVTAASFVGVVLERNTIAIIAIAAAAPTMPAAIIVGRRSDPRSGSVAMSGSGAACGRVEMETGEPGEGEGVRMGGGK